MAVALAATIVSGFVLHVRGGNGLTALHLICMGSFTLMVLLHALSHGMFRRRKGFGELQHTEHIQLNPHKCAACWECVAACPKQVLDKIDLPFHKHAKVANPEACIGCKKCVKACKHGAIVSLVK